MVYSHCTGMGPGPVHGPNGKYSTMLKCSHWLETGTGTRTIVFYYASPVLIGGFKWGAKDARPRVPNFFHVHAVFGKKI